MFPSFKSEPVATIVSKEEPKIDAGVTGNPQSRWQLPGLVGDGRVNHVLNGKDIMWARPNVEKDLRRRVAYGFSKLVKAFNLLAGKARLEDSLRGGFMRRVCSSC